MKRFLRKRWHGIPIGLIATIFICTAVVAAGAYITVTQTITQEIVTPEPPPDYGEIVAPEIAFSNLETGKSFTKVFINGVTVDLKAAGAGKSFNVTPAPSELYANFKLELVLIDKPADSGLTIGMGLEVGGSGAAGVNLDAVGLYTFTETITVTAGSTPGMATSTVAFTLEEGYPEPPK
ncbi:unnamed protein product [marine sediment metagenome]|uniref:Uncharacterized protein n=1 Tax=marine sediment metagenome TaxID=412755 RepID=X1S0U5_9ZZZZ